MKNYAVVGLGRFGAAVARELMAAPVRPRNEVLAIDIDEQHIQDIADEVTHAVHADLRDPEVVQALNVAACDAVIVAVGTDISTSVLIVLNLKEAGARQVIAKASSEAHRRILEKLGADYVVFPEHDFGVRLAQTLTRSGVYEQVELSEEYSIARLPVPKSWRGKSLRELDARSRHEVEVLAVYTGSEVQVMPDSSTPLPKEGGALSVLGTQTALARLERL